MPDNYPFDPEPNAPYVTKGTGGTYIGFQEHRRESLRRGMQHGKDGLVATNNDTPDFLIGVEIGAHDRAFQDQHKRINDLLKRIDILEGKMQRALPEPYFPGTPALRSEDV